MWINDRTLLISGYGRFDRGWSPLKRADLPAFWVSCVVWRVRCDGFEFGDELAQAAVGGEVGAEPLGVLGGEGLGDGAGAGFAGSGKSGIAESVAYELRLGSVLRWHVTSHTTLEEAVYRYDALGRLQDNQLHPGQDDITKFLGLGPLGTALLGAGPPRVLLIDELDKGELDLPSNLLNVLERGEYEIPELNRLGEGPFRIRAFDSDDTHAITGGRVQCTVFPILVSSIAPDELAALIRVALVAVGQEDRDPVCIRDALWLAATMNAADRGPAGQARPGTNIWRRRPSQKPLAAAEGRNAERSALLEGEPGSGAAELFDDGDHGSPRPAQGIPARRVTLGGPSSLLSTLELARALRPFRQHLPSRHRMALDIEATIRATAAAGRTLPVLRPGAERRFSADLVLDISPSMLPWHGAFAELVGVFTHVGAFRDVRSWRLHVDGDDVSLADRFGRRWAPGTFRTTDRRRVVIIVTDAVAEHWYRAAIWQHIADWGGTGIVALIDPLPLKLWNFSGIGPNRVRAYATAAAAANAELSYNIPRRWRLTGRSADGAVPVPIMELSPAGLAQWSAMVASAYPAGNAALLVESGRVRP